MVYQISNSTFEVEMEPDERAEILQNCRTILTTFQGTCPLYREFGLEAGLLDAPVDVAAARLTAELAHQIARYESRAQLKSADVAVTTDGTLRLSATIEVP